MRKVRAWIPIRIACVLAITMAVVQRLPSTAVATAHAAPSSRASASRPRDPIAQVLGLRPGMAEADARRVLSIRGTRTEVMAASEEESEREEVLKRELWAVDDQRFAWVMIVFDSDHQVRALQAYVRPHGPGLRYERIGDLSLARRLGFTILEWNVPPRDGRPGRRVTARGADPEYAGSVAIARTGPVEADSEKGRARR